MEVPLGAAQPLPHMAGTTARGYDRHPSMDCTSGRGYDRYPNVNEPLGTVTTVTQAKIRRLRVSAAPTIQQVSQCVLTLRN